MEDRHIPYTIIKEIHRFTNRLDKSLKQEDNNIKDISKEDINLLKEAIDNLGKLYDTISN